jgi:surface carbohydrate biosynthesis protein
MKRRIEAVVLPSETRIREFDAKLLVACAAAERGLCGVVGAKKVIDQIAASLPPSIYVGKSLTNRNLFIFRMLRRLGHRVVAWDEEGLVYSSPELYRLTKLGTEALNEPARLFAWGEENAEAWRAHAGFRGAPIHVTGNPRADLLRPELRAFFASEAQALQERYGRFILVNTNFSRINHFYPQLSRQRRLLQDAGGVIRDDGDPRLGLAAHKEALYRHFLDAVPALARRFPEITVIVRPHPSENEQTWRVAGGAHANVVVDRTGNAIPWLMAAGAVVHNGCTTAVETFLLDRRAIAFQPVRDERYDLYLPNQLSVSAADQAGLLDRCAASIDGTLDIAPDAAAAQERIADRHVAARRGAPAFEGILDILIADATAAVDAPAPYVRLAASCAAGSRALLKRAQALLPGHPNNSAYLQHMFPPLSQDEVEQRIARLGDLLGRFHGLRVRRQAESVYAIEAA